MLYTATLTREELIAIAPVWEPFILAAAIALFIAILHAMLKPKYNRRRK